MKLRSVRVVNFRGLKKIEFKTDVPMSVIVGPNAIGKSSILEAIRLLKAMLMPTYLNENTQVLQTLDAWFPATQRVNSAALLGDAAKALEISISIELRRSELDLIEDNINNLALLHIRNRQPGGVADALMIPFLSSPDGRKLLEQSVAELRTQLTELRSNPTVTPTLQVEATKGLVARGQNVLHQEILGLLSQLLPPSQGLISYFPADRSMPSGDVNIQLGNADAQAQLHSHIGTPAQKYNRLKQHLVTRFLMGDHDSLKDDFALVFSKLLPGKALHALRLSEHSTLDVMIHESATGATYDIDAMSSGEKGLLLTFFLMRRTVSKGGLVLLDEPELHLNPAVCKRIVPFLLDEVLKPMDLQAIVCTHSPEILAAAHDSPDCSLLHLRSKDDISPIYARDKSEVFEALKRLGSQPGDVLFSRGSLFVEGEHDSELLELGFPARLSGFKITRLGGRTEVEKEIRTLQASERKGEIEGPQCFVFDLDRHPTGLASTEKVKVAQWDRYCLENFLLDVDAIYDACKDGRVGSPPGSRTEVKNKLQEIAMAQLPQLVAKHVYADREPDNPGIRPREIEAINNYGDIARHLHTRLLAIRGQLAALSERWTSEFESECAVEEQRLRDLWDTKWAVHCDGKRALFDYYKTLECRVPFLEFKRQIVKGMAAVKSDNWKAIDSILASVLPV